MAQIIFVIFISVVLVSNGEWEFIDFKCHVMYKCNSRAVVEMFDVWLVF